MFGQPCGMAASNRSTNDDWSLLGAEPGADPDDLRRAFHRTVKLVHPDANGGDGERLRQVIEAFRRLDPATAEPQAAERPDFEGEPARLDITAAQAMTGGWAELRLGAAAHVSVQLPPGLRAGEIVRISGQCFRVDVTRADGLSVSGDDILMVAKVSAALLADGGRLTVETPTRATQVWISRADAARGFVRVRGMGLPERGARPDGDLLLCLKPAEEVDADSSARVKRQRFVAAWAA
jgi:curved DNA-binding protein